MSHRLPIARSCGNFLSIEAFLSQMPWHKTSQHSRCCQFWGIWLCDESLSQWARLSQFTVGSLGSCSQSVQLWVCDVLFQIFHTICNADVLKHKCHTLVNRLHMWVSKPICHLISWSPSCFLLLPHSSSLCFTSLIFPSKLTSICIHIQQLILLFPSPMFFSSFPLPHFFIPLFHSSCWLWYYTYQV